ncbi:MAG: hypothetical protein ACLGIC_06915 [Acidimicrobiia bacterium]
MTTKKNRPIATRSGVKLFKPTASYRRYRLVFVADGRRQERGFHDHDLALLAFDETVTYVEATTTTEPGPNRRPRGPRIVDDLMAELEKRWRTDGVDERYRQGRRGLYDNWVRPVCGGQAVREWGMHRGSCATVVGRARDAGLAPATVQNIGALLAGLVNTAHELRWLPASANPMHKVRWTATALIRGGAVWVPDTARPTTAMVDDLVVELAAEGKRRDLPWAGLMAEVGGYGGLRFGEQSALGPEHHDRDLNRVFVARAFSQPSGSPPQLGPTKNRHARFVLLPGSLRDRLAARAAEAAEHGPAALLFPGPKGPTEPFTEAEWRRLFIAAARNAGWEMVGDQPTKTGLLRGGHPAIPYRNLRHHAAIWMREVAGFDWADVSAALGHHSVAFTHARYERPGADAEARNRARLDDL